MVFDKPRLPGVLIAGRLSDRLIYGRRESRHACSVAVRALVVASA
jgi:sugar phosphate permease